jgi:hypothetical protein
LSASARAKREALLAATERDLSRIAAATRKKIKPLRGKAAIGLAVGGVIHARRMGKHFDLTITDTSLSYQRKAESIAGEAQLDGIYVIRTSVPTAMMSDAETVRAYKDLTFVERAFRCLKSVDLQIRPVHHWIEPRVRAHVFLCMIAYYVEWHLREAWAPILFHDHDRAAAEQQRPSPVIAAEISEAATRKLRARRTDTGLPVTSFSGLLQHLATLTLNTVAAPQAPGATFTLSSKPTPLQAAALDLIGPVLQRVQ